jgi:SAM-dependent methyltransferase
MNNNKSMVLIDLYKKVSKHSNYQILSKKLGEIVGQNNIDVKTRNEPERLKYIIKHLEIENKTVLDIGGNTGYFSFELLENGAQKVFYYEGNSAHAEFVQLASEVLNCQNRFNVTNNYYKFENEFANMNFDLVLLLNVLHHIGDDYDDKQLSINMAKENILIQLNSLSNKTKRIVFQLGFNWKGNVDLGLFENGTKEELVAYIKNGVKDFWEIERIGIAEKTTTGIEYFDLNKVNIQRFDFLGEFLNRPIFIMKSKLLK